jgi:hypothetical protein
MLLVSMVLPWFSLSFFERKSFKRFLPATIFICTFVQIEDIFATKHKWWWFYENLFPRLKGITPLIIGPFLVGTLWILKLTYGKFFLYLLTNTVIHIIFAFPIVNWLKKMGIASLVRLSRVRLILLFLGKAVLLYSVQSAYEYLKIILKSQRYRQLNNSNR